ncbi:MAG: hypothetical protein AAFV33_22030 [Chloroflexota bacterium]
MVTASTAVTPEEITGHYERLFKMFYGKQPRIRHMSGDWYQVNGEIVHRDLVEAEIDHLKTLCRKHRRVEQNVVKKLIARLRNM